MTSSEFIGLEWTMPTVGRHEGATKDGFRATAEAAFGRPAGSQTHEYTAFGPDGSRLGGGLIGSAGNARDACARLIKEARFEAKTS